MVMWLAAIVTGTAMVASVISADRVRVPACGPAAYCPESWKTERRLSSETYLLGALFISIVVTATITRLRGE